jgi:hypothetical protein
MQRYVSDELTHFVGARLRDDPEAQYTLLVDRILKEGRLGPGDKYYSNWWYGMRSDRSLSSNEMFDFPTKVCFCDIPVGDLEIHMQKYGLFGLAFQKSVLIPKGARPVFYIPRGESLSTAFKGIEDLHFGLHRLLEMFDLGHGCPEPLKKLIGELYVGKLDMEKGIIAYLKFFDIGTTDTDPDNYYMEREWRVLGQIQFALPDVWRIILPATYAQRLRNDLPEYTGQVTFSAK